MFSDYPDVLTVEQACKILSIGKSSMYALLKNNTIKHVKIGRKYVIPKISLIDFLAPVCYNYADN